MSANADSLRVRSQTRAMKKHNYTLTRDTLPVSIGPLITRGCRRLGAVTGALPNHQLSRA